LKSDTVTILPEEGAMQIEITTRHFSLGEDQNETIEADLAKLEKFSPRPVQTLKVIITHEAGRFSADSVMHLKTQEFRAKGEGMEPEFAVAEMSESLRKQLAKWKGKISGKQKGEEGGLGKAMLDEVAVFDEAPEKPEGFVLRDLDVEDAKAAFQAANQPFLIFRNVDNSQVGVIYRRENGELGHMESTS
jgi:ribosomal subunit interface protein